jgi:hypothetical protein
MSATEVTNAQYEQFDPDHRAQRHRTFNPGDDDAVGNVSWHDAVAFCAWLSEKEGKPYRLPTEAEWEYACRAGTTTHYWMGDRLPDDFWIRGNRTVAKQDPNPWGLYDMHGNVEEWCLDWYGRYEEGPATDPVGRSDGRVKVLRGGSDKDGPAFLRSSNRAGTLPEFRMEQWGFRVVRAEMPTTEPIPPERPLWQQNVSQEPHDWKDGPPMDRPYFGEILNYCRQVQEEPDPELPTYAEHHVPTIAWCPNGDMLTVWWTSLRDPSRTAQLLAARLRQGADEYDYPSRFLVVPDREVESSSIHHNGQGKFIWLNNIAPQGQWMTAPLVCSYSTNNGATWTKPKIIVGKPRLGLPAHMTMFRGTDGALYQPTDYYHTHWPPGKRCGSTPVGGGAAGWVRNCPGATGLFRSNDEGQTWEELTDPSVNRDDIGKPGKTAGAIAGPHGVAVMLKDGSLMGFARRAHIDGNIVRSMSTDGGKSWTYDRSVFPRITTGQRPSMLRLREGPIVLVAFTAPSAKPGHAKLATFDDDAPLAKSIDGWTFTDADGNEFTGFGLYASVSYDEGKTWPVRKLMTPGGPPKRMFGGGHHHHFLMDDTHAEPAGYTYMTQTPDGVIHLISTNLHYRFNLKWLETPPKHGGS